MVMSYKLYARDNVPPTVVSPPSSASEPTPAWSDATTPLRARATDRGTGVASLAVSALTSGNPVIAPTSFGTCPNLGDVMCPFVAEHDFSLAAVPEGRAPYRVVTTDGAGQQANRDIALAVDRSAPGLTLSGALYAERSSDIQPGPPRLLVVSAADGSPSGGGAAQRSGVQRVEVYVDGELVERQEQTVAGDSKPLSTTWTPNADTFTSGSSRDYDVRVVATDRLGHEAKQSFTVHSALAPTQKFVLEDWNGGPPVGTWKTNENLDFKGWESFLSDPQSFSTSQEPSTWEGRGLYARSDLSILAGEGTAEWRWKAPGTSTIYRSEYAPSTFNLLGCINEGMRQSDGSWQETVNSHPGDTPRSSYHPTACGVGVLAPPIASAQVIVGAPGQQMFCSNTTTACSRLGSPLGNSAVFGIQRIGLAQTPFGAYLPGARLYLTDYDRPYFTGATNSLSGWVHTGTGYVVPTATDTGLGVKSVRMTTRNLNGGTDPQSQTHPCTGDRNGRCPATWNPDQSGYAPTLTYNVDTLPEGENHFGIKAADIVGNQSLPADGDDLSTVPVLKVDRTPPPPAPGLRLQDPANGSTFLWDPSADPLLTDGTPGSGTTGYLVRYQVNGTDWSADVPVNGTSFTVPGAEGGDVVDIEVRATDLAGNVGHESELDVQIGPIPEDLVPDNDPTNGLLAPLARNPSYPATRFRLESDNHVCKTSRCWSTIRNNAQSWAVGNVRLNYKYPSGEQRDPGDVAPVNSTLDRIAQGDGKLEDWQLGGLSWYSGGCGWVLGTALMGSPTGSTQSDACPSRAYHPDWPKWTSAPYGGRIDGHLVRGNNCFSEHGTPMLIANCHSGSKIYLTGPTVECANVYAIPDGKTIKTCHNEDVVRYLANRDDWSGYCVNWRYVTRDRRWVMVRDTNRSINRGGWVFISTSALPRDRATWGGKGKNEHC
jgi:hypothetical protein